MGFCTKCGNQLMDEAIICVKCGTMVNQKKLSAKEDKHIIFNFVTRLILSFAIFIIMIGFIYEYGGYVVYEIPFFVLFLALSGLVISIIVLIIVTNKKSSKEEIFKQIEILCNILLIIIMCIIGLDCK